MPVWNSGRRCIKADASEEERNNMAISYRVGLRTALAAVALSASMGFMAVGAPMATAQDATPAASPTAECVAPELPPGTPTPPDASPEAAMEGMDMGTPAADVASPAADTASPVAEASPAAEEVGTALSGADAEEATAAANNLAACVAADPAKALALMTPEFLLENFGTGNPYDVLAMGGLEGLVFEDFAVGNSYAYADGRIGVDVQYKQGPYQVVGERWFLVNDGGTWKLASLSPNTPTVEGDTTVVGVNLVDYGFEFNVSSIVETEVLMLHAINAGAEPHEIAVIREPEGMTLDQITADPESVLSTAEFIGVLVLDTPGQQGDLALVGLEPGKYIAICGFTTADGTPHYMKGMIAEFEIVGV